MNFISVGKIVVLCAALTGPTILHANVGDSMTELRTRYGSAKDMDGQMLFEVRIVNGQIVPAHDTANAADHFTVSVYFDGAYSAMEVFTRNTSDPAKANLSQSDIDTILAATGQDHQGSFDKAWQPIQVQSGRPTWVTSDKKLVARFSPNASGKADDASVLVIMLYTDK